MARREPTESSERAERRSAGRIRSLATRFRKDCSGATAIEYGLIAGLTFAVFVCALRLYADRMTIMYDLIGTSVGKASS